MENTDDAAIEVSRTVQSSDSSTVNDRYIGSDQWFYLLHFWTWLKFESLCDFVKLLPF